MPLPRHPPASIAEHRYDDGRGEGQEGPNGEHTKNGACPKIESGDLPSHEAVSHEEVGHDPIEHAGYKPWGEIPLPDRPEEVHGQAV